MYIDKKIQELDEFFEIHFLYFNGVKMEEVKNLNSLPNRFEFSLSVKNYLRCLINEHFGFFKQVSRVFVYKFKNGKKTWSKVFSTANPDFFDYVNSRTKQEAKMEQEYENNNSNPLYIETFEPTSEHLKKSAENFKKEDGYQNYCELLKRLGKE